MGSSLWCMRWLRPHCLEPWRYRCAHPLGHRQHHWNAATSGLGLIALLVLAREWVPESGAVGAARAASAAAAVQYRLLFAVAL